MSTYIVYLHYIKYLEIIKNTTIVIKLVFEVNLRMCMEVVVDCVL